MKKIKVVCYKEEKWFDSKEEAIRYFEQGMMSCDPFSSEWMRYADIVAQLQNGKTFATDEDF